jgi:Protein of unknown function (DUF2975)
MVVLSSARGSLPLSFVLFALVQGALWAAVLRQVAKLAELYEQAELFTPDNVRRLRAIGLLCMPFCVDVGLVGTEDGLVPELDFSPSAVFLGALLVFVSWIMDEARRLREPE